MNDGAIDIVFILVSKPSTALVLALGSLSSRTMVANACDRDIVINDVSRGDHQALDDVPLLTPITMFMSLGT